MKKYYLVGILAALVLIIGGIFTFSPSQSTPASSQQNTQTAEISVTLSIDRLYEAKSVTAQSGETLLSLMQRLDTIDPSLLLKTKEYSGLGILIEGIGELQNGTDGKYWQYTVNGVMPQIGADKLILSTGDQIVWSFKASQE